MNYTFRFEQALRCIVGGVHLARRVGSAGAAFKSEIARVNLLLAAVLLGLVWFGNSRLRRKVDLDPADPHVLRVGPLRFRVDWATGTLTDYSQRIENTARLAGSTRLPRADGVELPGSSGTEIVGGVNTFERFALVGADTREEFAFEGFSLGHFVGQRLTIVWLTIDGHRHYMRFYSWDAKAATKPPYRYWTFIHRETSEAVWTAVPAAVVGWIVAGWLGLYGVLGGLAALVVWYVGCGVLEPSERKFERDYLDPLVAKIGAASA